MEELNLDHAPNHADGQSLSTSYGGTELVNGCKRMRRAGFLPPMEELNRHRGRTRFIPRLLSTSYGGTERPRCNRTRVGMLCFLPPMEELNPPLSLPQILRCGFLPPMEELNKRQSIGRSRTDRLSTSYGGTEPG